MKKEELCFKPADIMLPSGCDMSKWSVVACDQFTSEPEYWAETERIVGDDPSALRLILPEVFLEEEGVEERIKGINRTMAQYVKSGLFRMLPSTFILTERRMPSGKTRFGIMGMADLEHYDYNAGATSYIRATEGTVLSRLPPRVRVREGAPIELPHIMLLIDDPEATVIEPCISCFPHKEYDFELMQNGGHICGYSLPPETAERVSSALIRLADPSLFNEKYGTKDKAVLLFALGDGNHSLATAKQCWENEKKRLSAEEQSKNPKRFALVELVNLHDRSLEFEAIHRVVFDTEPEALLEALLAYYPTAKFGEGHGHSFEYVMAGKTGKITLEGMSDGLAVGALQDFLDGYVGKNGGRIDYIHGEAVTRELAEKPGRIGFLLGVLDKDELFKAVITRGVLPRKTFSMGEAHEKRYYLEARSLV